jgi:hypothetical protein
MCFKPIIQFKSASVRPLLIGVLAMSVPEAAGRFSRESMRLSPSERDEIWILTRAIGIFPQWLGDIS